MNNILYFSEFLNEEESLYTSEYPLAMRGGDFNDHDVSSDPTYAANENKFQEIQEYMKILLKPILMKKNSNVEDSDVEKVSNSFFHLGNNKSQEIKNMVVGCKDLKQCAKDIIDRYLKYVKINFNSKDIINDVEQDSVMTSERISI